VGQGSAQVLGDAAGLCDDGELGERPVDEREVRRNVPTVHLEHDPYVEVADGAGHGVALREARIIGGPGSTDENSVGVLEPAGEAHPPQIAGDVQRVILPASRFTISPSGA
jgi:hypothetical protein